MKHPALWALSLMVLLGTGFAKAAELHVLLPLQRTAYQTNEAIDISIVRRSTTALAAGEVVLTLQGEDASRLTFTFPVKKIEASSGPTTAVEHLHVNGWLLRPGKYTVEATCDGATTSQAIEVYSHVRRSSFRLINWGRAQKSEQQLPQGEDNLGFNLFYAAYGQDTKGDLIRAGVDVMGNCVMGGGHQMDLRMECDWSDPLVIRGGTRRVVRRAFADRTRPNVPGVHFYDEPGLTWQKDPKTGQMTPQNLPAQLASYEAAFGRPMLDYRQLDAKNPEQVRRWAEWARWKLGFMDAAWQDAQFGVRQVRPDYLSATQSQYGWTAFTDGYYFNVVRSLPIISGHGGYHDFGPGYFNPSYFLEFARAHDLSRPNWYLPTWYGNTTSDQFRLEQYLSFQTNIQGMMSPPDLEPGDPSKSKAAAGIVETNKLMGRLGTIFTTMPPTRPPVAVLYSLSQLIHAQTQDPTVSYAHALPHGRNLVFTYLAGKLIQQPLQPVLDEDVLDGTLAAQHKAVILTTLDYLDPEVIAGLEGFAKQGGLVLLTGDCTVKVKGAVKLDVLPQFPDHAKIDALRRDKNDKEAAKLMTMRYALAGAKKVADAIKPKLEKAGIHPVFWCDQPGIVITRQASGDVEYVFAVNATHDPDGDPQVGMKAVDARLYFILDNTRPIYDAINSEVVRTGPPLALDRKGLVGISGEIALRQYRFGPGQMRVFARTSRPIGGVKVGTPALQRDYTLREAPISINLGAAVLDEKGSLLSGSIPLQVRVLDPLGQVRYDLYRATAAGTLNLSLPLGLNDPAGKWTVQVTELLSNTKSTAPFTYPAVPTASAAAGATWRAVHLAQDRDNVFRFFRNHHKVTIVKGAGNHDAAAARLTKILKPWNVECVVVSAAEVNKPRSLTEEEARTWCGLAPSRAKAGDKNSPELVGFAVQGPVILLGNPQDNPLIKAVADYKFLPYAPSKEMPGPGRGLVAWQREAVGVNQESITLIAYDAEGMAEAVGTLYEMAAGIAPLTPWKMARASEVVPATKARTVPEAVVAWSVVFPDRIDALKADEGKITAHTHAGVQAEVTATGGLTIQRSAGGSPKTAESLPTPAEASALAAAQKKAEAGRLVKYIARSGERTAIAYWGGRVEILDPSGAVLAARSLPQDVTALAWLGPQLIVGDADGRLVALRVK